MPNTPRPTQLVPHFPREIIDNIINELSSDEATLKQCSTVSRSFQASTRRHLFFFINLYTFQMVDKLHRLLIGTPDIAWNIRKLRMNVYAYGATPISGENKEVMEWYANNTTLADILGMLPCLAVFVWETGRYVVLSWEHLSSNFRSAIVKLFQRPSLTTVVMKLPDGFPLCSLHHSPIKRLEISHIGFLDNHQGQLMLPHLEMLKILPGRCGNLGQMQLHVPSLQHISFCDPHDDGPEACALIQMAINTSARSLKRLWWSYDCSIPRCMYSCNLESATMIKFLTFDSLARSN